MIRKHGKFAYYFNNYEIHFAINEEELVFNLSYDLLGELDSNVFFNEFVELFESDEIEKICFDSKKDMF